jgi:hypothetical protein
MMLASMKCFGVDFAPTFENIAVGNAVFTGLQLRSGY